MTSVVRIDTGDQRPGADAKAPAAAVPVTDLQIRYLSPAQLRVASHNARTHSKKQVKQIARSIERFGFVNPVLISDDCEIIAGHGRVEAAKLLGLAVVPTIRLSKLPPTERRAYLITDNRLAELAGWDRELLAVELQGLLDVKFDDVELTGFALDEIDELSAVATRGTPDSAEDEVAADRAPEAVSRPGDQWELGEHRLRCGDDPLSCDVMIRRWQHYTGKAARLAGTALTFAEVETRRRAQQGASLPDARRK